MPQLQQLRLHTRNPHECVIKQSPVAECSCTVAAALGNKSARTGSPYHAALTYFPLALAKVNRMPAPNPIMMLARLWGFVGSLNAKIPTIATGILLSAPTRL